MWTKNQPYIFDKWNKRPMGHITHLNITTLIRRRKKHNLLFENWMVPYLNKLESPSPKGALCQVWLKLSQWFWRKIFSNFVEVFSLFRNYMYLPFEKRCGLSFEETCIPFTQVCFDLTLVEISVVVLEKKIF